MPLPKLIVILGTTACGKSGLGVELAKRFDGEIVSADSRQVYKGLDLGTGKVTQEEMDGVPHHLLDVVEPNQPYSVHDFQRGAYAAIDGILARGKTPFLVGGTGLYVRSVTQGFTFSDAPPDPALRAAGATDAFLEGLGLEYRYILWYLTGKIPTRDALVEELGRAIKRFAKRQVVWFKKDEGVLWLDMEGDPVAQGAQAVSAFLKN